MSERKVLSKYYPPDFDPQQLQRVRGPKQVGPKVQTVRLMSPFSMKCTSCGMSRFPESSPYTVLQIERIAKLRPQTHILTGNRLGGAKRNTEPWRAAPEETDEERLDRLEREEEEESKNAMAELEAKTVDAKREMAVADALDEIRTRNAAREAAATQDPSIGSTDLSLPSAQEEQDRLDAEEARKAFQRARDHMEPIVEDEIIEESMGPPPPPQPRIQQAKAKKPNKREELRAKLGIKRKT
ncbi:putative cell cycle control protein cwf16 protein [Eutypa lata UCREL1]|uniref:Putative cell cycle control protein cwf16 protein n=1 Tax=Eutypa lata (strain UCR-EL1) TaxID=1287681 RepID=M7SVF2_EUTLA|nr:putative cell cycle control protein cwf16 protein [Eutypa lata UCREL1]